MQVVSVGPQIVAWCLMLYDQLLYIGVLFPQVHVCSGTVSRVYPLLQYYVDHTSHPGKYILAFFLCIQVSPS